MPRNAILRNQETGSLFEGSPLMDGLIFLIDMPGGTPMNVVLPLAKDIAKSAVICGVNINMMTSAFAYRATLDFDRLAVKIVEDGRKAICEVKSLLLKK